MKSPWLKLLVIHWILVAVNPVLAAAEQNKSKTIQYSFTITNTSNRIASEVVFQTFAPVSETSWQVIPRTGSSHTYKTITDEAGNQILEFTIKNLPPFSSKIIYIRSEVGNRQSPKIFSDASENYLQPEFHIESDHPAMIDLAEKLKQEENLATAKAFFNWAAANIRYSGYRSKSQGALYALQHKSGDCTEYMSLFIALCRAAGIPARGIGGYVIAQDAILKPENYHNWAEFYHNGVWHLADPQEKKFMKEEQNYIAMRIIGDSPDNSMVDNGRFMVTGDNIKVKMN